eukprot:COSAG01_NODE_41420_length_451_cov_6.681818_2_plen_40_part_01
MWCRFLLQRQHLLLQWRILRDRRCLLRRWRELHQRLWQVL